VLLVPSAGSFIASSAFLPSTFAMICLMFAFGSWLRVRSVSPQSQFERCIFWFMVAAMLGWPFVAALSLPVAVDMLLVRV
jgi:alpha-1,2-mannosyltransferase